MRLRLDSPSITGVQPQPWRLVIQSWDTAHVQARFSSHDHHQSTRKWRVAENKTACLSRHSLSCSPVLLASSSIWKTFVQRAMENSPSDPNLTPALKAPDGMVSNLVDPPSEAYITIVVLSIFLIVTTPLVLIRLYTRHFITRHLWWDDCKLDDRFLNH